MEDWKDLDKEELLATLEAQQDYIQELEDSKEELQKDFDITARSIIGFTVDFGIKDLLVKSDKEPNMGSLVPKIAYRMTTGKVSFSKLEALEPILEKYQTRYSDLLQ
jgi:hypothetical protein